MFFASCSSPSSILIKSRRPICDYGSGNLLNSFGHVNSAKEILEEMSLQIPLFGMVKNNKHRLRALVSQTGEIEIINNLKILRFVTSIQDEAHRFALEYNKKLRKM